MSRKQIECGDGETCAAAVTFRRGDESRAISAAQGCPGRWQRKISVGAICSVATKVGADGGRGVRARPCGTRSHDHILTCPRGGRPGPAIKLAMCWQKKHRVGSRLIRSASAQRCAAVLSLNNQPLIVDAHRQRNGCCARIRWSYRSGQCVASRAERDGSVRGQWRCVLRRSLHFLGCAS